MNYEQQWSRLDNAAKIFPPTTSGRDAKVFRFSCELYEPVDGDILNAALGKTMELFEHYRCVLKKGFFWYYLEHAALEPVATEETSRPCAPIYDANRRHLLFEVTYYKKRINFEVFHALADGTGALQFLRTLVIFYLNIKHAEELGDRAPAPDYDASEGQRKDDSFAKYYSKPEKASPRLRRAHRLRGERLPEYRTGVIEGVASTSDILALSKSHGATATELFAAILICSIHESMSISAEKRPVVLSVPVNLRRFFPSASSRNFFGIINVGHDFSADGREFSDVLTGVKASFREQLSPEQLHLAINRNGAHERNYAAKSVPLVLKIPSLRLASWIANLGVTAALSNVGRVDMPSVLEKYIRLFDVFSSTNRMQICVCSFLDRMTLSFTSPFVDTDIQRVFFRTLASQGIAVEISTNLFRYEDSI